MWVDDVMECLQGGHPRGDDLNSGCRRMCADAARLMARGRYADAAGMEQDSSCNTLKALTRAARFMATGSDGRFEGRDNCLASVNMYLRRAYMEDHSLEEPLCRLGDALREITRLSIWNLLGMSSAINTYTEMRAKEGKLTLDESEYRAVRQQHILDPVMELTLVGPTDSPLPRSLLLLFMTVVAFKPGKEIVYVSDDAGAPEKVRDMVAGFDVEVRETPGGDGIRVVKPGDAPKSCWVMIWDAGNPPVLHRDVRCARLVIFTRDEDTT